MHAHQHLLKYGIVHSLLQLLVTIKTPNNTVPVGLPVIDSSTNNISMDPTLCLQTAANTRPTLSLRRACGGVRTEALACATGAESFVCLPRRLAGTRPRRRSLIVSRWLGCAENHT